MKNGPRCAGKKEKTMGVELEIKLGVNDLQLLDCILCDVRVREKMTGPFSYVPMQTTYFDTEDGALSGRHWMLRVRSEGETSVVTMKTAAEGYARGEWSVEAEVLDEAIGPLVAQGAPGELEEIAQQTLIPICGAKFTRILANLEFSDGSRCELAGDVGDLMGAGRYAPLCELELELKSGAPDAMLALAQELEQQYRIQEERRSKFARARALAGK